MENEPLVSETNNESQDDISPVDVPAGDNENPASFGEKSLLFLVMGLVLIVDQLTKYIVESWLEFNTSWAPIPALENIFRFTHVTNTGAAFGLFPGGSAIIMVIAVVVSLFIIIYNTKLPANHYLYRVALGLMLGGALGNFIDRVRQGYVTDFMDIGPWPVWNVSDLCVVTGVILLMFLMFMEQRREAAAAKVDNEGLAAEQQQTEPGRGS